MKRLWLVVLLSACPSAVKSVVDAGAKAPVLKLEPLAPVSASDDEVDGGEIYFKIKPLPPIGPAVPDDATVVKVDGETNTWDGAATKVLLVFTDETYLAQASTLLAKLDDARADVWFKHPSASFAYPVQLRDEPSFQGWIDEPVAGKLRVIHRADGFELQTNLGKLPGPDVNGPTVPVRGGKLDLMTLHRGLEKIAGRFKGAPDVCFVPSFGMALNETTRALAANHVDETKAFFATTCFVYPRPRAASVDGGKAP